MQKRKEIGKRVLSMFLSVSMFLAMGPMTTETVWAAESAENVIESGLSVKWGGSMILP